MAVSPNGAFVALACNDGKLRVMASGEELVFISLNCIVSLLHPHGGCSTP